mmetsp:Transcript_12283/g.28720  ORF Transcript_12283/g.28720 Transcript_12283/m.28720 type:complete len:172 (-) Transcript_12283:31-546(-)
MGDWWGGVNRALRISGGKRKETESSVHVLPDWVQENARLVYVSRSNGESHHVLVKKIEQRHKMVFIVFEKDKKVWKRVPFKEITMMGDGALKPLWKQNIVAATVPEKPADFVAISDEEDVDADAAVAPSTVGPAPQPLEEPKEDKSKSSVPVEKQDSSRKRSRSQRRKRTS